MTKKGPDAWYFLIHTCFVSEYVSSLSRARFLWLSVETYPYLRIPYQLHKTHTLERRLIMLKWLSNYYHCYCCHFGLLILLPLPPTCWGNRCNPLCQAYLVLRTKCRALCMLSKQSTNWVPSSAREGPDSENLGGCWAGSHRVDVEAQQDVQMMPRGPDLVLHLILWFPSSLFSRLLPSPLLLFSLLQTIATGDQLFLQPSHSLAQQPFELGVFKSGGPSTYSLMNMYLKF